MPHVVTTSSFRQKLVLLRHVEVRRDYFMEHATLIAEHEVEAGASPVMTWPLLSEIPWSQVHLV